MAGAESRLASDGEKLEQAKQIIDLALDLAKDCATSYRKARPDVRRMWNRAFFRTIRVRDGAIVDLTYEEPFGSLLGSHKGSMVEVAGFEPASPGDRLGLLRAQPTGRSHLGAPVGGGPLGQPGCDVPLRPPGGTDAVSLLHDARPPTAGTRGGRLPTD